MQQFNSKMAALLLQYYFLVICNTSKLATKQHQVTAKMVVTSYRC